ncbi:MAG: BrnT family toxin [Serpentinimonas sp.]|nr:BrnT family toxin [Serpentinimonas sp.]MDO9610489.1 BrnT family toxin [Serpentinimonas sp.]
MNFVWNPRKASSNLKKHELGFEEASTVFLDTLSITGADPDHSDGEERWLTFGVSKQGTFMAVAHADEGDNIRIISARRGTKPERKLYEEG